MGRGMRSDVAATPEFLDRGVLHMVRARTFPSAARTSLRRAKPPGRELVESSGPPCYPTTAAALAFAAGVSAASNAFRVWSVSARSSFEPCAVVT